MKSIVYDNIVFRLQKFGGISTYWFELAKRLLADEDIHSFFLTAPNQNILGKRLRIVETAKVYDKINLPLQVQRFINPSLSNINHPFIFHSSYNRISINRYARNITTVHDLIHHKYHSGVRRLIHNWQKGDALFRSSGIIAVSENTKKDLLEYYPKLNPDKVKVVYNGVSEDFYTLPDDHTYEISESIINDNYLLCISSSQKYKNFNFIVELASRLPEFKLYIVGPPPNDIDRAVLDKSLQGRWTVFSFISNNELNELYNHAYALIYPSSYEGFGIPLLEAMKASCPFIALNSSSIPEVAGSAGILLDDLDVKEFEKAIYRINLERSLIIEKGKMQSAKFSWDKCYEETKIIYRSILI